MGELGAVFGSLLPFLNHLRPTKSPLLMISVVIVVSLTVVDRFDKAIHGWMYHLPIYFVVLVTVIVAFTYTPPEYNELSDDPDADEAKQKIDIEHQFKFSRAFCLGVGIICLHLMFVSGSRTNVGSTLFLIIYAAIVLHVLLFIGYTVLRNIREESVLRCSVFQLGFLTGLSLLGAVLCFKEASPDLANFPWGAEESVSSRAKAIAERWKFASSLVFLSAWAVFSAFWIVRLRKIVRFSVTIKG